MSTDLEDKPDVAIHPPTVFLAALIIGFIFRAFAGGRLPLPDLVAEGVGGIILVAALMLIVSAVSAFAEAGEKLRPATPSNALLTEGVYQFTRNPMYLAMVLIGVGFGIATENLWIIIASIGAGAIINFLVIPHEEAYLERKFGVDYREFTERVRRWV